jgi:hypothetical protein
LHGALKSVLVNDGNFLHAVVVRRRRFRWLRYGNSRRGRQRRLIRRIAAAARVDVEALFHLIERALAALELRFWRGDHDQVGANAIAHAGELQTRIGALRVRPRVGNGLGGTPAELHIPTVDLRKAAPLSGELMHHRIQGHARIPSGDDHRQISAAIADLDAIGVERHGPPSRGYLHRKSALRIVERLRLLRIHRRECGSN